jgi:ribosomal protein L7/L12
MKAMVCDRCGAAVMAGDTSCRYCGVAFQGVVPGAAGPGLPADPATAKVVAALRAGNKIEAIKIYKEHHRSSLLDAKNAVDALEARLGR